MTYYFQTHVLYGFELDYEDGRILYEEEGYPSAGSSDASAGDVVVALDGENGTAYFGELIDRTNSTRNGEQSFDSPVKLPTQEEKLNKNRRPIQSLLEENDIEYTGREEIIVVTV